MILSFCGCASLKKSYLSQLSSPSESAGNPHALANLHKKMRVATVQYQIQGNQTFDEIVVKMESLISEAKMADADLIVFPELISLDAWPLRSKESESKISLRIANEITPRLFEKAKYWSATFGSAILVGSSPRLDKDKIRNTALLAFPDHRFVLQDKLFLTAWERKMGWHAGERLEVFNAPWGRSVILICYDVEFPSVSQALVSSKPQVILVPSMTESAEGLQRVRWSAQARAVEHHAFVIVSSTVGKPTSDWVHYGQSAIIGPRNAALHWSDSEGEANKPGIIYGDLEIENLTQSRDTNDFYPAKDQIGKPLTFPRIHTLNLEARKSI